MEPRPRIILIVEDDEDTRLVVKKMLHYALGCKVIEAEDGGTALELAAQQRPDLILMDLQLPHMSGLEAIGRLQANSEIATIPILVVSNHCWDGELAHQAKAAGAQDCLDKSQLVDILIPAVRPYLSS